MTTPRCLIARSPDAVRRLRNAPVRDSVELLAAEPQSGCVLLDIKMPESTGWKSIGGFPEAARRGPDDRHGESTWPSPRSRRSGRFPREAVFRARLFGAIDAALAKATAPPAQEQSQEAARKIAGLSPREREVLDGLVQGEAHKAIAHRLGISVRTVELHRRGCCTAWRLAISLMPSARRAGGMTPEPPKLTARSVGNSIGAIHEYRGVADFDVARAGRAIDPPRRRPSSSADRLDREPR